MYKRSVMTPKVFDERSVREEFENRRARVQSLEPVVVRVSKELVRGEVKNHQSFLEHEYFMKISEPEFGRLSPVRQALFLALWTCKRNLSVPGQEFWFESRKQVGGVAVDFLVSLRRGQAVYQAVVECSRTAEKINLENTGLPVLRFSDSEIWGDPLECAEKVFALLDEEAEPQAEI
jgi:very-short-patch-repair endonuclease